MKNAPLSDLRTAGLFFCSQLSSGAAGGAITADSLRRDLLANFVQNFMEDSAALAGFLCSTHNARIECIASGDATFSGRIQHWSRKIFHISSESYHNSKSLQERAGGQRVRSQGLNFRSTNPLYYRRSIDFAPKRDNNLLVVSFLRLGAGVSTRLFFRSPEFLQTIGTAEGTSMSVKITRPPGSSLVQSSYDQRH
jgi:hypothetical protein